MVSLYNVIKLRLFDPISGSLKEKTLYVEKHRGSLFFYKFSKFFLVFSSKVTNYIMKTLYLRHRRLMRTKTVTNNKITPYHTA